MVTWLGPSIRGRLMDAGDALLALALFAGSFKDVLHDVWPPVLAAAVVVMAALPVAVRRRWPLAVLASITAANCVSLGLGTAHSMVAGPLCEAVAIYSAARHRQPRPALAAAGAALLALTLAFVASIALTRASFAAFSGFVPLVLMSCVVAAAVGAGLRVRQAYLRELEDRAAGLERERDVNEARAVLEERARISRELHDIVAHHLSVVVLQAGAALTLLGKGDHPARKPIGEIERTGREALVEMRRMLGVLRSDDGPEAPLTPAIGLCALDSLAEQVRAAGLPVHVVIEGQPHPLPADLDRSAYRVVQEALTNCLRHAGGATSAVTIRYLPERLEIEVTDTGTGEPRPVSVGTGTAGHGLIGMRERATLLGGDFQAGPDPAGGFAVRVRLPIPPAP